MFWLKKILCLYTTALHSLVSSRNFYSGVPYMFSVTFRKGSLGRSPQRKMGVWKQKNPRKKRVLKAKRTEKIWWFGARPPEKIGSLGAKLPENKHGGLGAKYPEKMRYSGEVHRGKMMSEHKNTPSN